MRGPVMLWALRVAARNRELERRNAELGQALALANRATEEALRRARGWQARAELLAVNAGESIVPWLRQLSEIENLEERS